MHNDLLTIGKFTLHGYSVMIALGFIIAVGLCLLHAKKVGKNQDTIVDISTISIFTGFIGAKILYLIVDYKALIASPKDVIGIPGIFSGFVVYGGIIFGSLCIFIYCKIKKVDFFEYMDFMVPYIAIVQGFGRIGCFLAGCCYGAPTDSFLGVVFPQGAVAPSGVKLWPTQLFSAGGDFVIAGILLAYATFAKAKKKGEVSALYVALYSIGRFVVEFFRDDPRGNVGIFSTSQFIAIFTFAAAAAIFIYSNFVRKDDNSAKEVSKEESKAETKEDSKEEAKEETKEDSKADAKEETKETSAEETKEEAPEDLAKEESKEESDK